MTNQTPGPAGAAHVPPTGPANTGPPPTPIEVLTRVDLSTANALYAIRHPVAKADIPMVPGAAQMVADGYNAIEFHLEEVARELVRLAPLFRPARPAVEVGQTTRVIRRDNVVSIGRHHRHEPDRPGAPGLPPRPVHPRPQAVPHPRPLG